MNMKLQLSKKIYMKMRQGGEGKNPSNYVKAVVVILSAAFLPKSLCHNGKDRGPATKEPKQGTRWS